MPKKKNAKSGNSHFKIFSKVRDWIDKSFPTFKKWSVQFRITKKLLNALFIIAPIGAIVSFFMWFYYNYYTTPWELYQIIKNHKPSLENLDILPGYLDIGDLPGYFEARKTTIEIIQDTMEDEGFTMYNLVDLARCESTYNSNAYNKSSGATGLFQYKASTWGTTPYCNESIWDTEAQTKATIWMFEHNRYTEWECFRSGKLKSSAPYYRDYWGCGDPVE